LANEQRFSGLESGNRGLSRDAFHDLLVLVPVRKGSAERQTGAAGFASDVSGGRDSDYAIWQAFHNDYWPANYFIDGQGRIRHHHFGDGEYRDSERHPGTSDGKRRHWPG
jgi:hypothetical protein